ncbi:methyl-accepting chemotaxis protein [Lachnoclostridium phytofermentans]|uniref:Methyl-accepting chemotaxis sensory transducer n=1 Tax=Lachnoclostridium phytofermentans (strain ATCC 700394 / DSM 18823 / ISDg) TaxID=357809 RepID=A9KRD7_LACP7|nr:HAMP domain-containing methyl-accepting chemotaxis protein [Lachnoclostridium phytofermentans]ABX42011.1 methyl-accepting chemotaxis sensory transducer [Lachnoclostridium phytofermentans ISDg]
MKLTVQKKILGGFGILLAIIIFLGLLGISNIDSINRMLNSMYEKELKGISYIKDAQINILSSNRTEKNLILSKDPAEEAMYTERINMYNGKFEEAMNNFSITISNESTDNKIKQIYMYWEEIKPLQQELIKLNSQQNYDAAFKKSQDIRTIIENIDNIILDLTTEMDSHASDAYNNSDILYDRSKNIVIIVLSFSIVLSSITGVVISKNISKPIVFMASIASLVAQGNLAVEDIKTKNKDEIGDLAISFNTMIHNLRTLIKGVATASVTVASYSQELSSSSEETAAATEQVTRTISELAEGLNNQSQELEISSSNLNKISTSIQGTAIKIESVTQAGIKVSETANQGLNESRNAIEKIELVRQVATRTSEVVTDLNLKSQEIEQIVNVIQSIANQTNLLALNAAIEAARAGEQGKGFAVVAEEIRNLAEQSSNSTKKIADLIYNIQDSTKQAVDVIQKGNVNIYDGVEAVNKVGDSFESIAAEIDIVANQVQQVSDATKAISIGNNETVAAIDNIAAISEQSAASSQEINAAAEEQSASMEEVTKSAQNLAYLANELQDMVSKFQV